jgi:cytochrome P450
LPDAVDFSAPDFFADPYRTYADLRDHAPIYYDERTRRWFVTRYADVDASMRDPR